MWGSQTEFCPWGLSSSPSPRPLTFNSLQLQSDTCSKAWASHTRIAGSRVPPAPLALIRLQVQVTGQNLRATQTPARPILEPLGAVVFRQKPAVSEQRLS